MSEEKIICPDCKKEINENKTLCPYCGFDIGLYTTTFQKIYDTKLRMLDQENQPNRDVAQNIHYQDQKPSSDHVHEVRCPYCNSSDLTRITAMDKVVNIALFGLLGNKRRYQWHCNNCKTNW